MGVKCEGAPSELCADRRMRADLPDDPDVRGLGALLPFGYFKLDPLAFREAPTLNVAGVNEDVFRTVGRSDESELLGLIKPLDGAFHDQDLMLGRTTGKADLKQTLFR